MVEKLEKCVVGLLQEEHTSNSLTGQEGTTYIGNVDATIHSPNAIEEF